MLANHLLARHLADASFAELRRQLTYKAEQRGVHLAVVDRWYPSSKTCSCCGAVNATLALGERVWVCTECGASHERDVNAAQNILAQSLRDMEETQAAGEVALAGGAVSADTGSNPGVKLAAEKQEVKHEVTKRTSYA